MNEDLSILVDRDYLSGVSKCPFCGTRERSSENDWKGFHCGTKLYVNNRLSNWRSIGCFEILRLKEEFASRIKSGEPL